MVRDAHRGASAANSKSAKNAKNASSSTIYSLTVGKQQMYALSCEWGRAAREARVRTASARRIAIAPGAAHVTAHAGMTQMEFARGPVKHSPPTAGHARVVDEDVIGRRIGRVRV